MKTKTPKTKINVRLLRRIQRAIMAEPKRLDMGDWLVRGQQRIQQNGLKEPDCGTVGCIAGWAAVLDKTSDPKKFEDAEVSWMRADQILGLTHEQGNALFYTDEWPEKFFDKLDALKEQTRAYARVVCQRIDHFIKTNGAE